MHSNMVRLCIKNGSKIMLRKHRHVTDLFIAYFMLTKAKIAKFI